MKKMLYFVVVSSLAASFAAYTAHSSDVASLKAQLALVRANLAAAQQAKLPQAAVIAITNDNFKKEVEEHQGPLVIYIYASWCGPCQQIAPIFEDLEKELGKEYKFAKVNVDDAPDIAIKYGVTAAPTFIFINRGEIKGKETGYMSKEDLKAKLLSYLR